MSLMHQKRRPQDEAIDILGLQVMLSAQLQTPVDANFHHVAICHDCDICMCEDAGQVWANQAACCVSMRMCHCHTKRPGYQALRPSSYMTLASGAV